MFFKNSYDKKKINILRKPLVHIFCCLYSAYLATKNMQKICTKFHCKICDYKCSRKFLWEQHLATQKHIRQHLATPHDNDNMCSEILNICDGCGKKYNQRSGLWRHQKNCRRKYTTSNVVNNKTRRVTNVDTTELPIKKTVKDTNSIINIETNNIKNLQNENTELRKLMEKMMSGIHNDTNMKNEMMEQMKDQNKIIQDLIPRLGNNNNNRFNINVFLNEQCKNAINMSDFINSLQIQLDDLVYTKDNGLIEGVSTVFVNALKELDMYKRPIHCTDVKRETLYIKENNEWERDDNKQKLKTAINDVANKQRSTVTGMVDDNLSWADTEEGLGDYIKLMQSTMTEVKDTPSENKIIKNIVKETVISKDIMS